MLYQVLSHPLRGGPVVPRTSDMMIVSDCFDFVSAGLLAAPHEVGNSRIVF